MPQSATHVYLALSSPLVRIRMRHALANTFGIHVMDEVGDPIQAAEGIRNCEPQVIVCDERMIRLAAKDIDGPAGIIPVFLLNAEQRTCGRISYPASRIILVQRTLE